MARNDIVHFVLTDLLLVCNFSCAHVCNDNNFFVHIGIN